MSDLRSNFIKKQNQQSSKSNMQLTINNETYGLIWGTRAFVLAEARLNMPLAEIMVSVNEDNVITTLAYCAIQNWYENKDESNVLPFTLPNFFNWLDEQPQEMGTEIVNSYMESSYQGRTMKVRYDEINAILEMAEKETPSAKSVKKKSIPSVK